MSPAGSFESAKLFLKGEEGISLETSLNPYVSVRTGTSSVSLEGKLAKSLVLELTYLPKAFAPDTAEYQVLGCSEAPWGSF